MKETIKQLEKEIEEIEKDYLDWKEHSYLSIEDYVCEHIDDNDEYLELKTKLQTLKDVCEEIKRKIIFIESDDYKMQGDNKYDEVNRMRTINCLKSLLKKFQGEEE